jgi:hypothetical protein
MPRVHFPVSDAAIRPDAHRWPDLPTESPARFRPESAIRAGDDADRRDREQAAL